MIEKHDIGRRGQIQTGAAGLQADEKHSGAVVVLKFLHERPSVLGGTIEAKGLPLAGGERVADEIEHSEELGKDDDLLTLFHERFEEIDQRGELGALFLRRGGLGFLGFGFFVEAQQARVAANLAKAEEACEDVEAELVELLVGLGLEELGAGALDLGLVEFGLGAFHFYDEVLLDALGQVRGDLGFRAAQEKRTGAGGEAVAGEDVVLAVEVF